MIDVGQKIIMYGDAVFQVVQKYLNFKEIPKSVFPTSPTDFWKHQRKDKRGYKIGEPYVVVECVSSGTVKMKVRQRFIMPVREAESLPLLAPSTQKLKKLLR